MDEEPINPPDPIMPADEQVFWSASLAPDVERQMFIVASSEAFKALGSGADFGNYNNYLEVGSQTLDIRAAQHYRYNKTYRNNEPVGYGGAGVIYWTGSYSQSVPSLEFNVIGSIYN